MRVVAPVPASALAADRPQHVAEPPHRVNDARTGHLQLAAQGRHVHLDEVHVVVVEPPHHREELGLRQHGALVPSERHEQRELHRGQLDRQAVALDDVRADVDVQVAEADDLGRPGRPAHDRLDLAAQLGERQRQRQHVVGAGPERGQAVVDPCRPGEHQERHVGRPPEPGHWPCVLCQRRVPRVEQDERGARLADRSIERCGLHPVDLDARGAQHMVHGVGEQIVRGDREHETPASGGPAAHPAVLQAALGLLGTRVAQARYGPRLRPWSE